MAKQDLSSWPITKNFDIALQVLETDARIRPGLSAGGRIAVEKIADGILIPGEAVFEKNGRSVVYVQHGSSFEERPIQIARRGKSELLIGSGLQPAETIALKDPTQEKPQGR